MISIKDIGNWIYRKPTDKNTHNSEWSIDDWNLSDISLKYWCDLSISQVKPFPIPETNFFKMHTEVYWWKNSIKMGNKIL